MATKRLLSLLGSVLVCAPGVAFSDNDIGRGAAGTFVITALLILFVIWPARRLGFGREARD